LPGPGIGAICKRLATHKQTGACCYDHCHPCPRTGDFSRARHSPPPKREQIRQRAYLMAWLGEIRALACERALSTPLVRSGEETSPSRTPFTAI